MLVASYFVTDLGKVIMIKIADLKVMLGKYDWDDNWDEKNIQNLCISPAVLQPNCDLILLDAEFTILKLLEKIHVSPLM